METLDQQEQSIEEPGADEAAEETAGAEETADVEETTNAEDSTTVEDTAESADSVVSDDSTESTESESEPKVLQEEETPVPELVDSDATPEPPQTDMVEEESDGGAATSETDDAQVEPVEESPVQHLIDSIPEQEVIPTLAPVKQDENEVSVQDLIDSIPEPEPLPILAPIEKAEEEPAVEEAEAAEAVEVIDDGREWYVVHCYSGYENKVRHNLEQRIETMGMKSEIFDVFIPTEEEIEIKDGKRTTKERRVFPGYILVNMILTEESWYVVRNTPGVTSFVGMGNEPIPLRPEEVAQIIKRMEADAPRIKVTFKSGERVRIIDGPFNDFRGIVDEIDMDRAKVRIMVNFFGRETPVELDFLQVEKA